MKPGYRPRVLAALLAYQTATEAQAVADATRNGSSRAQVEELLASQQAFDGPTTLAVDLLTDLMWLVDAAHASGDPEMEDLAVAASCCGPHWLEGVAAKALSTYAAEGTAIAAGAADDDPGDVRHGVGVSR